MDSNLLKVFVAVANNKSVSLGAKALGFAQSNVTSRVKQLEKNIGFSLFHRVPKGVILTKEGEKLYPYAVEIVKKVEEATYAMKNINVQKQLIIGSTESYASTGIIPFLSKLHSDFPKMQIELITNTTKHTTKALLNYKVDIAFVSGKPKSDEMEILNKIEETIVLVEPKDISCPDVYLTFKNGCAYNEFGKNYLDKILKKEFKTLEFGNYEIILGCVKAGMGRSILPLSIVEKLGYKDKLTLKDLPTELSSFPTYLVARKDYLPKIEEYLKDENLF